MAAAEVFPRSTWRKKPSQKGKYRFKLLAPPWKKAARTRTTPAKTPLSATKGSSVRKPRKTKKTHTHGGAVGGNPVRRRLDMEEEAAAGGGGDGGGGNNPVLSVRRRLDLADDDAAAKIGGGGAALGCFSRAALMDNLRFLAKLAFGGDVVVNKPPLPKTEFLRCYSRAQLMDNLRSLAAKHVVVDTSTTTSTADDGAAAKAGKKKTKRVPKLVLKACKSDDDIDAIVAAAGDDEGPMSMALVVVRNESAGGKELTYVPRWEYHSVAVPDAKTLRELVQITPAIEAAYNELVRSDETCLGDDLDEVPEGPELEAERRRVQALVDKFMGPARAIIGKREFCHWKGSVLTNVVGTFLTQNVTDVSSSNSFINLAAKFSLAKNESNAAQSTNVALITDGRDLGVSKQCDKGINELLTSLRTGEISNWELEEVRVKEVLEERFKIPGTVDKISQDIKSFLEKDTSRWKYLLEEAYKNGYRKKETSETIDWEALLHASFGEIEELIKERGTQSQMTFRILLLLIRIKRDQGSFDLEWLRYIPRAKAKEYLQSIIGIGDKSVACIRLLSLRHRGFPVDVNVARIVTRLGWVPLQPLGDNIEFHMVEKNPVMAIIQKRIEPIFCKNPSDEMYELHCQLITIGKVICTDNRPHCGACPFTKDCKYYKSLWEGALHPLLKDRQQEERGQTNMDERIHDLVMVKSSREPMYQCQTEMGKSTERHSTEPIIEMPPTPPHEYPESSSEEESEQECQEEYEQECQEEYGQVYHNTDDIEDIPYLDIRGIKPTENAIAGVSHGTDMVLIHPHDDPIPIKRRYGLRTEYLAYIIPDGHEILDKFEPRVHGDCNPYLFIIRDYNDHSVNSTILITCRTANREIFPLDGTYFQINEVFADHSSTRSPIQIKRDIFWNFERCRVYFGTSLTAIAKGQTQEGIERLYHSGYICCREFDRGSRRATKLSAVFHYDKDGLPKNTGKKRHMPDSSPFSVEGNDRDI